MNMKFEELRNALENKDTNLARSILQNNPELIGFKDKNGYTAFILASAYGHTDIVKLLLANGQSHPEFKNNQGKTALMLASLYGYTEIVELLLDTGESHPEYRDNEGETALMLASTNGNTEVVKLLLNSGESHPGYQDNDGYTALIFASAYAHTEIVKLLLATGESHPEFINGDGWTALMYAIRRNNTEIIKLLEEYQKQYEPIVGNNPSVKLITDESIFSIGFNSNTIENENPLDPISLEPIPRNLLVVAVPFSDNTKTTCFNGQYLWQWWIVLVKGNPPVPANHPLTREEFDAESISSLKEFLNKNIG